VNTLTVATQRIKTLKTRLARMEEAVADAARVQRAVDAVASRVRVVWNDGDAVVWSRRWGEEEIAFILTACTEEALQESLSRWQSEQVADYLGVRS
jgi:hypothetical protein